MRSWRKSLRLLAGGMVTLGSLLSSAHAQYPPGGGGMMPPGGGMMGPPPGMMPPGGGMGMAPGMPTGMPGGGPTPGAFGGNPNAGGMPAEFPNPAKPSAEPASPFTMKDEGMGGAFTEQLQPPARPAPYALTLRGEYVGWRISHGPSAIPLVTTTASPSLTSVGQLGNGNTATLIDAGNPVDYGMSSGYRLTAGIAIGYLPPIELSYFHVNRTATVFSGGSLSNPTQFLAVPFQDVQSALVIPGTTVGTETASVISIPVGSGVGAQGGTLSITSQMSFWGLESNMFIPINDADTLQLSLILGYRHLQLNETLNIATQVGGTGGGVLFNGLQQPAGIFTTSTLDSFGTANAFDGGQFGLRSVLNLGQWTLFSDLKMGLGSTAQTLNVNGVSTLMQTVAGRTSQSTAGGILALASNSGNFTHHDFSIVPEANFTLSFQVNHCIRVFGGYDFLYWTRVTRPGDALSNVIDSRQIPTSANFTQGITYNGPGAPSINTRSFTAQGIFGGIEIGF